ncbi:LUD domain-containing protein, partial [Jatrophihabitans endophyticus]|uniref:LutC/YkgG family protein n=1 Tax=Jatrophihabitans endophyticus TaxID=1206085 RepID=UPI0019E4B979
ERVADYRATVHRDRTVDDVLRLCGVGRVVVPDGLPDDLQPGDGVDVVRAPVTTSVLDEVGVVLTGCAVAIAETGTIVLDHAADQGARALTLVPDHHVVVVHADQIVPNVPDALALLDPTRPLTWISGPSATSDIELDRVEGVHGPRRLDVVVLTSGGGK